MKERSPALNNKVARRMTENKPNPRTIYSMTIEKIIDHTDYVRELILKTNNPEEFHFRAGQFVMLHVPQPEGKPLLRAYSIASAEHSKNGFNLLFKYVENGKASEFVWNLKGHESLQFTGPFGRVFFQEPPTPQIVFMNTGTGLSQHFSYLQSMKNKYPEITYRLFFGVRTESDIYYQDKLELLKKELKNFEYHYVLSRPSQTWSGKKGYVQNYLAEFDYINTPTTFYLCGNGAMIKDVKKQLIEVDKISPQQLWCEAFD